jgi:hypothetical protein
MFILNQSIQVNEEEVAIVKRTTTDSKENKCSFTSKK